MTEPTAAPSSPAGAPALTAQDRAARLAALRRQHQDARHRRDAAVLGGEAYQAAAIEIGAIEVEINGLLQVTGS